MKIRNITKLLIYSIEKERDADIWSMWMSLYPMMATKQIEFVQFSKFKNNLIKKKYTDVSLEDVEEEMLKVVEQYERR